MRTDVTVDTIRSIRCPQIPHMGAGRPSHVTRGDWIEWKNGGLHSMGRVIGSVVAPEDKEIYLVAAMQMLGGCVCERWVKPEWVFNTARNSYEEKQRWISGDDFLDTPPDVARNVFNLTTEEMKEMSHEKAN